LPQIVPKDKLFQQFMRKTEKKTVTYNVILIGKITFMLRIPGIFIIVCAIGMNVFAETDLQKLVNTELAFAKKAADTNTRQAFLDFTAADGVIFNPTALNAKAFWEKRAVSPAALEWHPTRADVSADGQAGWDTGPWQYKPKGKDDKPVAFGQFSTFWVKQADGSFKFLVDMGIGFENSGFAETEVKYPSDAAKGKKTVKDVSHYGKFDGLMAGMNWSKAYEPLLAEDCVMLRDGKSVIYGKKDALAEIAKFQSGLKANEAAGVKLVDKKVFGNLSYFYGELTLAKPDGKAERHNFFQVWKYRGGKWQIVLDVMNDIPDKA
jgi:hypothetical protein